MNADHPTVTTIERLTRERDAALERVARLERDVRDLNDNLTATQTRCTELLLEVRVYRREGERPR